jgi:AraC-like DNA-binding protein
MKKLTLATAALEQTSHTQVKKYFERGGDPLADNEICEALTFMTKNFVSLQELSQIAAFCGLTKQNLCKRFKRRMGMSPMNWLWSFRCHLAMKLIQSSPKGCLLTIAVKCGFKHQTHFSKKFKEIFGMKPSSFRGFCRKSTSIRKAVGTQSFHILPTTIQGAFRDTMEHISKTLKKCSTSHMALIRNPGEASKALKRLFESAFLRPVVISPRALQAIAQ